MGQRWAKRTRQLAARVGARQHDDTDALFAGALSAIFTWMIAGEQPSAEGITEALSITGLNDDQDPEAGGIGLEAIHLDTISIAIDRATEADWLTDRQNMELLAHCTELHHRAENWGCQPIHA